jgi:hypothetical protein
MQSQKDDLTDQFGRNLDGTKFCPFTDMQIGICGYSRVAFSGGMRFQDDAPNRTTLALQLPSTSPRFCCMDALDDLAGELILDIRQLLPQEIPSLRICRSHDGRIIHHQHGDAEPIEEIAQGFRKVRKEFLCASQTNPMSNGTRIRNGIPRV